MRFAFTEDQLMFRDAVRDVLARECPPTVVRKAWEDNTGRAAAVYKTLAETGVVSAIASEDAGGMGMTELDIVLALDECGYAAIPDPIVETALVAIPLIEAVGTDALKATWLPKLVSGEAIAAVDFDGASFVAHAPVADLLLFVRDGALHAVARADVTLDSQVSVDRARRIAAVAWTPSAATLVASGPDAAAAIEAAKLRATLGTSALLVGLTRRMLDMTVEYAKVRDRPALHAWVGHRLLGLSAISAVLGVVALRSPAIAIFCLLAFVVAVLVAVSWLTVGAGRFHVSAS